MAYVAPLVLRLDGLSAATENPYGTDAAPVVTTNAIRPGGQLWPQLHVEYLQTNLRDDAASGGLVPLPPAKAAARRGTLTCKTDYTLQGAHERQQRAGACRRAARPHVQSLAPLLPSCSAASRGHVPSR